MDVGGVLYLPLRFPQILIKLLNNQFLLVYYIP